VEKRSSVKDSDLSSFFRTTQVAKNTQEAAGSMTQVSKDARAHGGAGPGGKTTRQHPANSMAYPDPVGRGLTSSNLPAVIRVVGVGGAGTNAVNHMLEAGLEGVESIAINTDAQALSLCQAHHKLRIGRELTKGLGGGSDPQVGREAAVAAYDEIKALLSGSDMVFITAGEGGGTGTGAAPVVAEIAKSLGALTIGVVSRPFAFEGKRRGLQALEGVRALRQRSDTVIVVPNDKLLQVADKDTSMIEALRLADDVLRQGVQGICDLVTVTGLINLDLADVRTIMTGSGTAHMGIGRAQGGERAEKAAEMAINSSLLETSIDGARGILLSISGGSDLSLYEVAEVAEIVNAAADPEANIIFGAVVDESLGDSLWVTVVAVGFDATSEEVLTEQVESGARPHQPADPEAPRPGQTETGGAEERLEVPPFLS